MRETIALEIEHRARASQARNKWEGILEELQHRFPDPGEEPAGGWPNVDPDDLTDLTDLRTTISYEGTRNIHDKLLTIAHQAGPRQLGVGQLAQLLVKAGQYRHNRGAVQNQVRICPPGETGTLRTDQRQHVPVPVDLTAGGKPVPAGNFKPARRQNAQPRMDQHGGRLPGHTHGAGALRMRS